jgi:hypothetical protein
LTNPIPAAFPPFHDRMFGPTLFIKRKGCSFEFGGSPSPMNTRASTLGFEGNSAKCVYSLKPTIWPPDFQYMENHGWNQCWNPGRLSHGKLAQRYRPARQLWPHFRPKCWWEMPALSSDLRNGLRAMKPSQIVLLSLQPSQTHMLEWIHMPLIYIIIYICISDEHSHVFWAENLKKTPTIDG